MTRHAIATAASSRRSLSNRAAVTNGALPGGVSKCSAAGRRFQDVIDDLRAEIGGELSSSLELQVRAVAGQIIHVEQLQGAMLRGEPVDSDQFTRASNAAARGLSALKRLRPSVGRQRAATTVADYLNAKRAAS